MEPDLNELAEAVKRTADECAVAARELDDLRRKSTAAHDHYNEAKRNYINARDSFAEVADRKAESA